MLEFKISFQNIDKLINSELKVDLPLEEIADLVFTRQLENILTGSTYKGGKLRALRPETLKRKRGSILYETGQLFRSIVKRKVSENKYEISIEGQRKSIASILQQQLNLPFFGYSNAVMQNDIQRILQKTKVSLE